MKHNHPKIEIMDTTLRDGEQTSGVSFVPHEKLMIARLLLEDLKADRVEVASARVSEGEFDAVKMICDWAARRNMLPRVEVLGFVDGHTSVDWIHATGCRVINLLCKGSLKHCTCQLRKTPEEHIEDIIGVVNYANEQDMEVNIYLEDWSNGMKDSPEYVFQMVDALMHTNIKRYMLPDTLGVLNPLQVIEYMRKMVKRYPHAHFDFHPHNDYDLAVSNVLAAVLSGAKGLHTTINGLGERAGNAPLSSVQAILKDHFNAITNIDEGRLNEVSRVVESYSGIAIPANKPIVGENVFTQVAGVHADGDNKSNLYCNDLLPERFGRKREYALGKNSGKANIRKNLEDLGLTLDEDSMRKVTERIIELGDKKELVTQEDLPYIVSDVLKHGVMNEKVKLKTYIVNLAYGLKSMATLKIEINGQEFEESSSGDGQYDAFVRALRKIYKVTLGRKFPMLTNYAVTIPPGGRTDAFVQTVITWSYDGTVFRTRGLDADQTEAAIKATMKMLNIIEDDYDSEFRFSGKPVPAMKSLDSRDRVIYINTFTKSLAPSMRISYMILPPKLLEKFMKELGFYACTVPVFEQLTLSKFMGRGHFERHIRRMKKLYRQRRDTLTESIESCKLKNYVSLKGLDSGLHVLMKLNNGMNEKQLVESAAKENVKVYGLSEYYSFEKEKVPKSCIVAGYSGLDEKEITQGIKCLEQAWT